MLNEAEKKAKLYEIKVRGHLGPNRFRAFEELAVTLEANGKTTIAARIVDQAALYGLLVRIRDLGLPLLSVCCLEGTEDEAAGRQDGKGREQEEHDDYE